MEYYLAIQKNTFESVLVRWMKLVPIIHSEVSQKKKLIQYINAYIWNLESWTLWEKARVGCFKRTASKHVYYLG